MPVPNSLLARWQQLSASDPDAPVVADGVTGEWIDRGGLNRLAAQWVARLPVTPNLARRPVVFTLPNGAEWLACLLALWRCEAIAVPLDPTATASEAHEAAKSMRAALCITPSGLMVPKTRPRRFRHPVVLGKATSGTTGAPRVFYFSADELLADGLRLISGMSLRTEDVHLAAIPLGHSYGIGNLVVPALAEGHRIVCASAVFPGVIADEIKRFQATVFPATPPLLESLVRSGIPAHSLSPVRLIISAGAPLSAALAQLFEERFRRRIHNFYGSSETGGIAFDPTGSAALEGRGVGQILPGVNVAIARSGRIRVSSSSVAHFGRRSREGPDSHLMVDKGVLNAAGELILTGRTARWIKLGARRIDPQEVERVLRLSPRVKDALVTAIERADRSPVLGAVVAGDVNTAELRAHLAEHLAPWKRPKRLRIVSAFPQTARGKPHRRAVLALLHDEA